MEKAVVLLFDGYADWEIGNILAELRRLGQVEVVTAGFSPDPVVSMGGLNVQPDIILCDVLPEEMLIFILPGGNLWEGPFPGKVLFPLLRQLGEKSIPMAAICAATTVLAKAGILEGKKHTSNSIKYLSNMAPDYESHSLYVDSLAVRDQHVITASGLGAIEFTREILEELNISTPDMRALWFDAFKHGTYPEDIEHKG